MLASLSEALNPVKGTIWWHSIKFILPHFLYFPSTPICETWALEFLGLHLRSECWFFHWFSPSPLLNSLPCDLSITKEKRITGSFTAKATTYLEPIRLPWWAYSLVLIGRVKLFFSLFEAYNFDRFWAKIFGIFICNQISWLLKVGFYYCPFWIKITIWKRTFLLLTINNRVE